MVGDFILRVDSVVGSAACVDSSRCGKGSLASYGVASAPSCSVSRMTNGDGKNCGEVAECRICQEEGDECDLESPCACTGTLKVSVSSSTLPLLKVLEEFSPVNHSVVLPIENVYRNGAIRKGISLVKSATRQSWSSQFDLRESHLLAISAAEQELLNADYEDYAAAGSRVIAFCHTVALILMLLLFIRQVLNAMTEAGMMQDISSICDVR
ncbi:hypothetical protein ZIOFF_030657 [Zingiber officinale]|uniref:RING-CH-type domain-containing protein n=1 Tax=Zingiber officinale TaxID=94328 RepID=A0A8J5GYH1_ZINOF|nr:hypothetical protein ZIOFF_030657 [Zingiber officinale]